MKTSANKKYVTVYCGSSSQLSEIYLNAATALGKEIANAGATLITGAGKTGMMGAVADAALNNGGDVHGIIPQFMVDRGWQHNGLTELEITPDMHSRKSRMAALATGCIALPGGVGTFEELTEIITWKQLGLFKGNVVIYNVDGYYDALLAMFDTAVKAKFIPADHTKLYSVATDAAEACRLALLPTSDITLSPKF